MRFQPEVEDDVGEEHGEDEGPPPKVRFLFWWICLFLRVDFLAFVFYFVGFVGSQLEPNKKSMAIQI